MNGDPTDVALHEVGHSFGKLADEYTYGTCNIPDTGSFY